MWLFLVAVLIILFYLKFIKPYKYWHDRGVPYIKPWPIIGNLGPTIFRQRTLISVIDDIYRAQPDKRYIGIYQFRQPRFVIRDLDLIKTFLVKESETFPDHNQSKFTSDPLWSRNLVTRTANDGWHELRATMSPFFSSSKLKSMFVTTQKLACSFTDYLQQLPNTHEVEFRDAFGRYTTDVMATAICGVTCNSLKDCNNEFYVMTKKATGLKMWKFFGFAFSPFLMRLFKVTMYNKDAIKFFRGIVKEIVRLREERQVVRQDLVHLLVQARRNIQNKKNIDISDSQASSKLTISDDDITAQILVFLLASIDSMSTGMCYVLYELAINPDIQIRAYNEIKATLKTHNDLITYEALSEMKYLDNIVIESLRKWPITPAIDRKSVKPFIIEPQQPNEQPVELEAGTVCWIPTHSIHMDPKYFPNPEKFDPDRYSDQNKHNIKPYTYMPFGSGPRVCIGSRFAVLQSKLIIAELLRKFSVVPTSKTQIPLILGQRNFNPFPESGIWLSLKSRSVSD